MVDKDSAHKHSSPSPLWGGSGWGSRRPSAVIEWPTWILASIVYGGWLALTYFAGQLPWWVILPAAAWISAWQHSLQHEIIHNHPTRTLWVNTALGFLPLSLWLPYIRYRDLHLIHHRDHLLTDPIEDPESYYLSDQVWQRRGPIARWARRRLNTFAGRILLGPFVTIPLFLIEEIAGLAAGSAARWRVWGFHMLGVIAVLLWVEAVCGIPLWQYLLFFVYPGAALTAIRSFAEHRAAIDPNHRTAIVENAPILGLLFLYNNLHVVHHLHPGLPWYAIPRIYRENRASILGRNNGLVYRGYSDVVRRYLMREHHPPVIPQGYAADAVEGAIAHHLAG
jgi:fatty acid desaturase